MFISIPALHNCQTRTAHLQAKMRTLHPQPRKTAQAEATANRFIDSWQQKGLREGGLQRGEGQSPALLAEPSHAAPRCLRPAPPSSLLYSNPHHHPLHHPCGAQGISPQAQVLLSHKPCHAPPHRIPWSQRVLGEGGGRGWPCREKAESWLGEPPWASGRARSPGAAASEHTWGDKRRGVHNSTCEILLGQGLGRGRDGGKKVSGGGGREPRQNYRQWRG